MSETLFHGTSRHRYRQIAADGFLKCAQYGDKHVSLTDTIEVAQHFAEMAVIGDLDVGVSDAGCILRFDRSKLVAAGLPLEPFCSSDDCQWERETACLSDISATLIEGYEVVQVNIAVDEYGEPVSGQER